MTQNDYTDRMVPAWSERYAWQWSGFGYCPCGQLVPVATSLHGSCWRKAGQ